MQVWVIETIEDINNIEYITKNDLLRYSDNILKIIETIRRK